MKTSIKKNKYTILYAVVAFLTIGLFPLRLKAVPSFDSISFKPASDHGYYLTNQQSQTLKKGGYSLGVTGEYAAHPFKIKNQDGGLIQEIIRSQINLDFGGSIGLMDWLDVGLVVTGVPFQKFVTPGTLVSDDGARMGDILVNFKAKLLDNEKYPLGLAVVPFMTIPTGNSERYTGNGKVSGGAMVVLDTHRMGDTVSFAVNAGTQFRERITLPGSDRDLGHQFIYGASTNLAIAKPIHAIIETTGWTTYDRFFSANNNNLEINGALRFYPGGEESYPLAVTVGGGAGILKDNPSAPDWRVFTTVAYRQPKHEEAVVPMPPPPVPEEEVITTNEIHFAFNKYVIKPESHRILDEIFENIDSRPEIEMVRVEGHTDSVGSESYNEKLSQQRANSVRTYLIHKGYPAEKITAVGMGEASPLDDNTTVEGRAKNRRVEFHLQTASGAHVKVKKKSEDSPTYEEGDEESRHRVSKRKKYSE